MRQSTVSIDSLFLKPVIVVRCDAEIFALFHVLPVYLFSLFRMKCSGHNVEYLQTILLEKGVHLIFSLLQVHHV